MQNRFHNVWSKEKEEWEIYPDFMALNRLSLSQWLEAQTWLDCHKTKLDELIPRLGYFDVLSWFEDWLSKTSDLRNVLSVRVTKILEQSSFGRWFVWIVKRYPFELNFGQ
jgi:hypothetical protein